MFYVIGYRKKVILTNLTNAFPEKKPSEINRIHKDFLKYFCDLLLETFKTLTISRKKMLRHCKLDPSAEELFKQLAEQNKSIIIKL